MKIIVTHSSPDMDAITSVWLIKRYLPGWEAAEVKFVSAGERLPGTHAGKDAIEKLGEDEIIHVDTGLGPLDHHQTESDEVCGASLTWDYIKANNKNFKNDDSEKVEDRIEAIDRIVKVVVDVDHFKEVFWPDSTADYHEFSIVSVLDGLKLQKPDKDMLYVNFISECLDALLHEFANRIWAEQEIKESGIPFETRFGKALAFETINDSVIKLAQKMGYVLVVRKDPRKGYVRIKSTPRDSVDLTLAYEQLKKIDPDATWFLHASKKMLLNGSAKNPKMKPTSLPLEKIVEVLKKV